MPKGRNENKEQRRTSPAESEEGRKGLDRRRFLKAGSALAVAVGLGTACDTPETGQRRSISMPQPPLPEDAPRSRIPGPYEEVPQTPTEPPDPTILEFFTMQEARTVDALAATILPGDENDPGAREAGVLNYIDHLLAHEHGFAEPIYRMPPFAEPFTGDSPPATPAEGPQPIWVAADQLPRYGYQSSLTPREIYRQVLPMIDDFSRSRYGSPYADLPVADQEAVMEVLASSPGEIFGGAGASGTGQAGAGGGGTGGGPGAGGGGTGGGGQTQSGYSSPSVSGFFEMLRTHVIQGMFADPLYGGNRNMVGWRLIGFPGAQRAYTPIEMRTEGTFKEPQSIAQLPHFHPGQPANEYVILPVSGSERRGDN